MLSPATVEALRERLAEHEREKAAHAEEYHDTGLVFTTPDGMPLDPRNFIRAFEHLVAKAGLPRIRFHDLRHTRAALLLAAGIHPEIVSERLGHSDIGTTMDTYSHVLPTMKREAAATVDRLLGRNPKIGD